MTTIRTARKTHYCVNNHARRAGNAPGCFGLIHVGDRYEEGDCDPYEAGGFGHEKICAGCSEAVRTENNPHAPGRNCHVCGAPHGTRHYFAVCAKRIKPSNTAQMHGVTE